MTVASSSNKDGTPPIEFLFKGKGKRVKVNPPGNIKVQWAEYVNRLPAIHVAFNLENQIIFTLDDYSAHLAPEVEEAFDKNG